MATVGDWIVHAFESAGIKRIYGLAGDSLNGITDAVRRSESMEWMHVRHEEAAAFAAGAEAHLTGQLTVCAGSCGPGNLHLINGLYDCHRSRVPVLAIASQIPSQELNTQYFQETHPEHIFAQCSHYCGVIGQPDQVPRILRIAMQTALSERGVAVIVLPGNLVMQPLKADKFRAAFPNPNPRISPSDSELDELASLLNDAKRITILGGAGCAGAHAELVELAGLLNAPIVHALRGKEYIEFDNPYDVGMTGLLGFASGYHAMMNCQLLLMLGTDFPYQQFYPDAATIVQIDRRGEQIGRRIRVDHGYVGDVKTTLQLLLPKLLRRQDDEHLKAARADYVTARQGLDDLASEPTDGVIHPQYLTRVLDELANDDAIFTCDVGTPTVWAARYLTMNGRRRLLGSFNHGSMANALPQAMGAAASHKGRQVIAMAGDGGIAMMLGDLLSLRQLNLPVKIVVFKNDSLGFVELEMKAAGLLDFGTDLKNPDFAQIAQASGILGRTVNKPEDIRPTLTEALAHSGPALIEVAVTRQELSMPPTITFDQVRGLGLFMLRAVISGRGSEVIDLAKVNLFRNFAGAIGLK